eukprot:COSAG02_NODE_3_length_74588_cov_108.368430_11_plen_517_part_00
MQQPPSAGRSSPAYTLHFTPSIMRARDTAHVHDQDFDPRAAELKPLTGSPSTAGGGIQKSSDAHTIDGDDTFDSSIDDRQDDDRPGLSPLRPAWASAWRQRAGGPTETCLVLLTAYATIVGLFMLQSVMVPLVTALFISTLLLPMLDLLTERPLRCCRRVWCQRTCRACLSLEERHPNNCCCTVATSFLTIRLPNPVALILVVGLMLSFFFAVGVIVQQSVMQFTEQLPLYESAFRNESRTFLAKLDELQISPTEDQRQQVIAAMSEASRISSLALSVVQVSTEVITFATLVMLYVIFILLGSKTSSKREKQVVLYTIERQLQLYVTLKVAISTLCGVAHAIMLNACGIDLAAVFGVLTFLLNFIPTVGLTVATLGVPLPIIWLAPVDGISKITAIAGPYLMSFAVSNFVEPALFGARLNLHPVVVLFALVFWNMLWGITGALLSVPIMSAAKIILINMRHPTAQWFAALLEGAISIDSTPEEATSINRARGYEGDRHGSFRPSPRSTRSSSGRVP